MQDLLDLSAAIHARGMYLMVDIVSGLMHHLRLPGLYDIADM